MTIIIISIRWNMLTMIDICTPFRTGNLQEKGKT